MEWIPLLLAERGSTSGCTATYNTTSTTSFRSFVQQTAILTNTNMLSRKPRYSSLRGIHPCHDRYCVRIWAPVPKRGPYAKDLSETSETFDVQRQACPCEFIRLKDDQRKSHLLRYHLTFSCQPLTLVRKAGQIICLTEMAPRSCVSILRENLSQRSTSLSLVDLTACLCN
jgi:hypothetical protein